MTGATVWAWITKHFSEFKVVYLAVTAVFTLAGAGAGSIGQQWLTQEIDSRIDQRITQVEHKLDELQDEMLCSRIEQEIERLRSELWELETQLVRAREDENVALVNRLMRRINEVQASLNDEIERRTENRCAVTA